MSDAPLVATPSQTVGPFFHFSLTADPSRVLRPPHGGERIRLLVIVTDGDERPVPDAVVELWHAVDAGMCAFARMPSAEDGTCEFETVRPDAAAPHQAPHLNVCFFARGLLRQLHTRIYFAGDAALDTDPALALVPEARRSTLLAVPDAGQPGRWQFNLRLQGRDETVFFDA